MQRPKSHYRTGKYKQLLKDGCKDIVYHSKKPDLDNLVKLILDLCSGENKMICDDNQVCMLFAEKKYAEIPRTEVTISEIL